MTPPGGLVGTTARALPRPSRTYGAGRVCADEACPTVLSRYNPGRFCARHEWAALPRGRSRGRF